MLFFKHPQSSFRVAIKRDSETKLAGLGIKNSPLFKINKEHSGRCNAAENEGNKQIVQSRSTKNNTSLQLKAWIIKNTVVQISALFLKKI